MTVKTETLARFEPVAFDERIVSLVERIAAELGRSVIRLPSGAGYDAQMLARVCPAVMVFVPGRDGVSHNPAEYTAPKQIEVGANLLLATVPPLRSTRSCRLATRYFSAHRTPTGASWNRFRVIPGGPVAASMPDRLLAAWLAH